LRNLRIKNEVFLFCFVVVWFCFLGNLRGFEETRFAFLKALYRVLNAVGVKAQWSYFLCRRPVLGFMLECWLKLQMAFSLFCSIKVPLTV